MLRITGARMGEVVRMDDAKDIDFRDCEIRIATLKRRGDQPKRIVPVLGKTAPKNIFFATH
jgi:hypothetical protein